MKFIYEGFLRHITESFVSEKNDFVEKVYTLEVIDYDQGGELNICVRNTSPAFVKIKDMLEGKTDLRDAKHRFSFALKPCILPYSDVTVYTAELFEIVETMNGRDG